VVIRAYNPEISGTEKPMDFAFLNALVRSEHFPPHDPWLAGFSISYYYFGYLMSSALIALSGVSAAVGFNLSLASLFALVALGAFSLVFNLVRASHSGDSPNIAQTPDFKKGSLLAPFVFGLVGVTLLGLIGNLEGLLEILYAHGIGSEGFWEWVGVKGLTEPYQSSQWFPTENWWWWKASRVIDTVVGGQSLDYTITEFPFFSFLLGDLHPHVMSLPFGLLALGLTLNVWQSANRFGLAWLKANPLQFLSWGICIGSLGFINSWDLLTYGGIFAACLIIRHYRTSGREGAKQAFLLSILLGALAVTLYLPFYGGVVLQGFGAGAIATSGAILPLPILPWTGPGTRPFHFLLLLGPFVFLAGSFLLSRVRERPWLTLAVLAPMALWLLAEFIALFSSGPTIFGQLISRLWPLLPLAAVVLISRNGARSTSNPQAEQQSNAGDSADFVLTLIAAGLLLVLATEWFFLRDIYGNRMNTVFKFYYQVWALLAIASAFILFYFYCLWCRRRANGGLKSASLNVWWGVAVVSIAATLVYTIAALPSKTGSFSRQPTLDGLAFVVENSPAEAKAIAWLEENADNEAVIVEAVGEEWSGYGRISSRTGLATILGWAGHEVQWRGSNQAFKNREQEVATVYQSQDVGEVARLLEQYEVTYIYWGRLEKTRYGQESPGALKTLARPVFSESDTVIYEVRQ
jgi:YYY domain-containing protein